MIQRLCYLSLALSTLYPMNSYGSVRKRPSKWEAINNKLDAYFNRIGDLGDELEDIKEQINQKAEKKGQQALEDEELKDLQQQIEVLRAMISNMSTSIVCLENNKPLAKPKQATLTKSIETHHKYEATKEPPPQLPSSEIRSHEVIHLTLTGFLCSLILYHYWKSSSHTQNKTKKRTNHLVAKQPPKPPKPIKLPKQPWHPPALLLYNLYKSVVLYEVMDVTKHKS